jgi:hypothetical protein
MVRANRLLVLPDPEPQRHRGMSPVSAIPRPGELGKLDQNLNGPTTTTTRRVIRLDKRHLRGRLFGLLRV